MCCVVECAALLRYMGIRAMVVDFTANKPVTVPTPSTTAATTATSTTATATSSSITTGAESDGEDSDWVQGKESCKRKTNSRTARPRKSHRPATPKPSLGAEQHADLVAWIRRYFQSSWTTSTTTTSAMSSTAPTTTAASTTCSTSSSSGIRSSDDRLVPQSSSNNESSYAAGARYLPPLYFQHEGHSRTLIGNGKLYLTISLSTVISLLID